MRLRVLELPTEHDGDRMRTPFVFVLDDLTDEQVERVTATSGSLRGTAGARGALVFRDRVDLGEGDAS